LTGGDWALAVGFLAYVVAVVFVILYAHGWKPGKYGAAISAAIGGLLLGFWAVLGRRPDEDDLPPSRVDEARKTIDPLRETAHELHTEQREQALGETGHALEEPTDPEGLTPEEKLAELARRRRG
jgi:hypothetical protein